MPGLIAKNHQHQGLCAQCRMKNRAAVSPGRRVGTAEEVAQVILMLMTNGYMTEKVVHVNGGGGSV